MRYALLLIGYALAGCCLLPSVQKQHPSGYDRLIKVQPKCEGVGGMSDYYGSCGNAAEILEQKSTPKATAKFITLWDQRVWAGGFAKDAEANRARQDAMGSLVVGGIQAGEVKRFEEIVVPVMAEILKGDDPYSVTMRKQLELVEVISRPSFDSFREAHSKAFEAAP